MTNDLMMSELARARIADLYREAEVRRLSRAARHAAPGRTLTQRFLARLTARHARQDARVEQPPMALPRQCTTSESATVSGAADPGERRLTPHTGVVAITRPSRGTRRRRG